MPDSDPDKDAGEDQSENGIKEAEYGAYGWKEGEQPLQYLIGQSTSKCT